MLTRAPGLPGSGATWHASPAAATVEGKLSRGGQFRTPGQTIELRRVKQWQHLVIRSVDDSPAAEEPLEIRITGFPLSVAMRTPGHVLELAAGFLIMEGII